MRTFMVVMASGLAALVGLAGAANADETVELIWTSTGTNDAGFPPSSSNLALQVLIVADGTDVDGTLGGEISIDYTEAGTVGKLTFLNCVNGPFPFDFVATANSGTVVSGVGATTFTAVLTSPTLLATCNFHKEPNTDPLTLQTFYSPGEGVSNLPSANFPVGFGTAVINDAPEPGALSLLALGFGGLIVGRNRKS